MLRRGRLALATLGMPHETIVYENLVDDSWRELAGAHDARRTR